MVQLKVAPDLPELPPALSNEPSLIDASIAGEPDAFAALYDLYVKRVYRYIYYRVRTLQDAEDLTQEVFLRAWRGIRRYRRTGAPFFAWLVTIAHNLVVRWYQQKRVECPLGSEAVAQECWADPEAETSARNDRAAIHQAILQLKPEQQHVVIMRLIEEVDYPDIAAALGKGEGNVRVILHRALVALRHLLAQEVNG